MQISDDSTIDYELTDWKMLQCDSPRRCSVNKRTVGHALWGNLAYEGQQFRSERAWSRFDVSVVTGLVNNQL